MYVAPGSKNVFNVDPHRKCLPTPALNYIFGKIAEYF